jgi:hypothetical protein
MNRLHLSCLLAAGLLLSACAHQMPGVQAPREERPGVSAPGSREQAGKPGEGQLSDDPALAARSGSSAVALSDVAYLDERLFAYEEKFLQWQAVDNQLAISDEVIDVNGQWAQCQLHLGTLYNSYDRLREQAVLGQRPGRFRETGLDPWQVLRADIAFLESDCESIYQRVREHLDQREQQRLEPARKLEVAVNGYVENLQYKDGLQAYRSLEQRFPGWQPSLETKHAFGLALLHTGQIDKAGPVLLEILPQLEPAAQLALKRVVADILWVTYRFDEAKSLYLSLSHHFSSLKENEHWVADQLAILENVDNRGPEMAAYISLLRVYLAFDGRHIPQGLEGEVARITRNYPGSIIDQRAQQILQRSKERVSGWLDNQIVSATTLKEQKQFSKALAILKGLQQEMLPAEARQLVQRLTEEVLLAESAEKEKEMLRLEQDLTSRWEEASHLLDLEHFDEAHAIFLTLLGSEYEARARSRMKEAANRAASEMRREAANLFVRARESVNAERKMDFLLESRRLLKTIMDKYPDADISNNVVRNLEVINQHIHELSPEKASELLSAP